MKPISRFRGPSLLMLATVHILIFVAGLVASVSLSHGGASFVAPFADSEKVRLFFAQSSMAARIGSFFLFGSAVPFGLFAVTTVSRLRFLGVRAAGADIALLGGLAATFALLLSGIAGWILSVPDVSVSAPLVKAIYYLSFLAGGVLYSVGFGLLAAGVSVTSYFMGLLPRWLAVLGILLAITGEFSWFSLLTFPANFLIPITRYGGFIWMFLAAVALTKDRRVAHAPSTAAPS